MADPAAEPAATPPSAPDAESLGPVLDFLRLLWKVDHGLQGCSKRMEHLFGITAPQRLVLRIVGLQPGVSAGRVAEILHVHPSTLTGILQRLQARGLLLRRADPKDGRRALLSLTAKGKRASEPRTGLLEDAVRRMLTRMPHLIAPSQALLEAMAAELDQAAAAG